MVLNFGPNPNQTEPDRGSVRGSGLGLNWTNSSCSGSGWPRTWRNRSELGPNPKPEATCMASTSWLRFGICTTLCECWLHHNHFRFCESPDPVTLVFVHFASMCTQVSAARLHVVLSVVPSQIVRQFIQIVRQFVDNYSQMVFRHGRYQEKYTVTSTG